MEVKRSKSSHISKYFSCFCVNVNVNVQRPPFLRIVQLFWEIVSEILSESEIRRLVSASYLCTSTKLQSGCGFPELSVKTGSRGKAKGKNKPANLRKRNVEMIICGGFVQVSSDKNLLTPALCSTRASERK